LILQHLLQAIVNPMEVPLEVDDVDIIDSYSMPMKPRPSRASHGKAMELQLRCRDFIKCLDQTFRDVRCH
jgi:hypothetical protein